MLKRTAIITGLAISALSLGSTQAQAALNWNWTTGGTYTGSGTFTTTDGASPYTITGITGTFNGHTVNTLLGVNTYNGNDNLLYDNTNSIKPLSEGGFSFTDSTATQWNIYSPSFALFEASNNSGNYPGVWSVTFSATQQTTAVPFEFSPEQGFMLGIPVFLGLRQLKKRKLAK